MPLLLFGATCDGVILDSDVLAAAGRSATTTVRIHGAGHLAFSDLCELDLRGFGEELLVGRDDVDAFLLEQLLLLGSDGCANGTPVVVECASSGFLPLEVSDPMVRAASTLWLVWLLLHGGSSRPRSPRPCGTTELTQKEDYTNVMAYSGDDPDDLLGRGWWRDGGAHARRWLRTQPASLELPGDRPAAALWRGERN